ncbi:hypothetical protein, partial [Janibacter sp. G1551]|uniref:hypothetical protein n=1 Tax=Janibacter sp. G1551 TaxID=3420440 RepID=UPI003CFF8C79
PSARGAAILGGSHLRVEQELPAAVAALGASRPGLVPGITPGDARDEAIAQTLASRFHQEAAGVMERRLADNAWLAARLRRGRHREHRLEVVAALGLAVALVGTLGIWAAASRDGGVEAAPAPDRMTSASTISSSRPSSTGSGTRSGTSATAATSATAVISASTDSPQRAGDDLAPLTGTLSHGGAIPFVVVPRRRDLDDLPWRDVGLPATFDIGAPTEEVTAGAKPVRGRRAVAAYLRPIPAGYDVVIVTERGRRLAFVDRVIRRDGAESLPIGQMSIRRDGRMVALIQRRGVLTLDVVNGLAQWHAVPADLSHGGWGFGRAAAFIAFSPGKVWTIDPEADAARRLPLGSYMEHYRLVRRGGSVSLRYHGGEGQLTATEPVRLPVTAIVGGTFGSLGGWSVTGVDLDPATRRAGGTSFDRQALAAVQGDQRQRALLLAREDPFADLTPMGWADDHTAVVALGPMILAWDVISGDLRRVTHVRHSPLGPLGISLRLTPTG